MNKFSRSIFVAGLASLMCLVDTSAQNISAQNVRVIVGFHGDIDAGIFSRFGGAAATRIKALDAAAGTVPAGRLNALRRHPGVAYVEEDLVRQTTAEPNDTYYNYTFSKRYERSGYNDQRDDFALINAQQAWNTTTGAGVLVAVLDTGCETSHTDVGNVQAQRDFTGSGSNASDVTDSDGHGTHTAGTVAAGSNNGKGVSGTAWNARLAIGKVLGPQGGYDSWIANGMIWAVNTAGAPIVSMSLGGVGTSTTLNNACATVWNAGGITIAASGNEGTNGFNHYPSAHPDVVAVAAVDEAGRWASFSNYGDTIEVAAPGVNVLSTFDGNTYGWSSGTSMACPHVAGVAALAWSANPTWNNATIRSQLTTTGSLNVIAPDGANVPIVDAAAAIIPQTPQPNIAISSPAPGASVSGTSVTVGADAAAGAAGATVSKVEFFVDAISGGSDVTIALGEDPDGSAPYEVTWDSTTVDDGSATVSATVTDSDNATATDAIEVTVDNVDDPPVIAITSPADGSVVSGDSVVLSADASDDGGAPDVQFFVDGTPVGSGSTVTWDSTTVADGPHAITATASDGVSSTSDGIDITVNNTPSAMSVTGINPDTVSAGSTTAVVITGTGFGGSTTVTAINGSGAAPVFSNVVVIDTDGDGNPEITADVSVKSGGPRRNRTWDISVTSGGASDILAGGFTVTP